MSVPAFLTTQREPLSGLLAQRENWTRLGEQFSGDAARFDTGDVVSMVLACAVAGGLIWLLHWLARQQELGGRKPNHAGLFRELCRAHGLDHRERQLLRRLAKAAGVAQPAEVFVRPAIFTDQNRPAALNEDADAITRLHATLFSPR